MFNNPYIYQSMYRPSLISRLFGGSSLINGAKAFNWSNFLTNAQKSLGIVNQAIPLVNQVKPMLNNAKTMFKIANAVRSSNNDNNKSVNKTTTTSNTNNINNNTYNNKPIFYI